jgi:hypothetical protein
MCQCWSVMASSFSLSISHVKHTLYPGVVCKIKVTFFFRLSQDVCVDERVVGFKGRHQLKQYLSNKKTHRWGIKLWVLAESSTVGMKEIVMI